ncbi:MAG: hypothetical protein WC758_04205 [Candidatus Woesearchaeota archaeon]|jgi:hypothetical protein
MNIINISFTNINANRTAIPRGGLSIANNVKIESVDEAKMGASPTKQAFKVGFSFKTDYNPNFATIELKGEILVLGSNEEVTKVTTQWSKEKKLDPESARTILNSVMNRCALEVIILSKELGLPSPIPLPSIKAEGAAATQAKVASKEKVDVKKKK